MGTPDREYGMRLATADDAEGAIYMLNLMKYREEADYGADGERGVSGREADDRYAPIDVLERIGAAPVFMAHVVTASEDWDRVAIVRYPTRRAFIDMQRRDDFKEKVVHKEAGMDHTIVMGTLPEGALPSAAKPGRIVLDVWKGDPPPGEGATFTVEGTILGDGRSWSGARFSVVDRDAEVDVTGTPEHQRLLLHPSLERWQ